MARRGSKVDGNPNLITIQLCILCILWLDPTTSNPASCATLKFFRQFFSFHALEIRPPTLFHGHNCTIICHLFHWLVFSGNKCCQNLAESPLRAGWRLGGWRSNTIPLKMVYRNLMNAQIPLISAGTAGKQDRNAQTKFTY